MKKIIAVFCTAVLITSMLAACSNSQQTSGNNVQSSADFTSTTESTTMRTTEDLSTTFKEAETNTGLSGAEKGF